MQHISDPLLQAYIDGFCNEDRINEVEAHVDACEECRERLESARAVAQRASQLLGTLDPGPVHAPSFDELQARAAARVGGESADASAGAGAGTSASLGTDTPASGSDASVAAGSAESAAVEDDPFAATDIAQPMAGAVTEKAAPVVPLWRRPAMAWAATLVIAFGLGWRARAPSELSRDLSTSGMPAADGRATEAPAFEQDAAQEVGSRENFEPGDEIDELQASAAAKQTSADELEAAPEGQVAEPERPTVSSELPAAAAVEEAEAVRRQVAQNQAAPAERRAAGAGARGEVAATPPAETAPPPPAGADMNMQFREANESLDDRVSTFADAGHTGVFVSVAPGDAVLWLGAPPRQIPDLTLARVEVGPGTLAENGIPGRVAVRLVYLADTGQEIALLQQYTGPLEGQGLASVGEISAGRAAAADTPARLERARAGAESRADLKAQVGADRDALVGGLLDLPATTVEPETRRVTYRWLDTGGYVLAISGELDADVLRGLADLVR